MEIQVVFFNQIQPKIMARNEAAKLPSSYALLQRSRAILGFLFCPIQNAILCLVVLVF